MALLLGPPACRKAATPPRPLPELRAAARVAGDPRLALELAEAVKCRHLRTRLLQAGATPHSLPELDRVLVPSLTRGEAILSLYAEGARLRRFWVDSSGVRELSSRELASVDSLVARLRDELELGENLRGSELDGLLAIAHKAVLGEAPVRTVRRLLVLPDGVSRALPVHTLIDDGEALLSRVELAYAPCLALFRPARRAVRAEAIVPAYGREEAALPGALKELALIKAVFPRTSTFLGRSATPARFEAALGEEGSVIHFAGHGLADLEPRQAPQLLFPEGSVSAGSATRRPVAASHVVLASCATAEVARFRDGQRRLAAVTLPEALLAAGASRVVAASWAVKDLRSAAQLRLFYGNLKSRGAAAALAVAQRQARSLIAPPHPRFWAFYAVYGGW